MKANNAFEIYCEVIYDDEDYLTVVIDNAEYQIYKSEILAGTEVRKEGDEGLLIVSTSYAEDLGL